MLLFPNPVQNLATLSIDSEAMGELELEIISVSGQRAGLERYLKSSRKQNFTLDLSDLTPGSYFCLVTGQGMSDSFAFVKAE
jgi:hypothetical protein